MLLFYWGLLLAFFLKDCDDGDGGDGDGGDDYDGDSHGDDDDDDDEIPRRR